jgi:N-acetylglucosaminyldiphosphoundecaprenol N-acetyl-beta-D-mannosaminyltransferase
MVRPRPIAFLGVEFEQVSISEALDWIMQQSKEETFSYLVTPNVDHIVQIHGSGNADAAQAFRDADFVVCDSRILALLGQISGLRLPVVPGSDLTRELLCALGKGTRLAVVGGDDVLLAALAIRYPKVEWMAHYPPMGVLANPAARQAIADFVSGSRADIVLFAIGAPQSEITCHEIARQGKARGTALCIGASLEFLTGAKKRAPHWMQRFALEWLFRLLSEPGRLWRRYLVVGPRVLMIWWRWRFTS